MDEVEAVDELGPVDWIVVELRPARRPQRPSPLNRSGASDAPGTNLGPSAAGAYFRSK